MTTVPDISKDAIRLGPGAAALARPLQLVGLGAIGVAVLLALVSRSGEGFLRAYVLNFAFFSSLVLGALWFVMLQHLTRAGWSVVVRRIAEILTTAIPLLAVLALPIVVLVVLRVPSITGAVYPWTDAAHVEHSPALLGKTPYLNTPFFVLRMALYFAVWLWLSRSLLRLSLEQDANGDIELTRRMETLSAPGMLLYALTVTFFSIDVLMSMAPTWYSTIFGVYYFAGGVVGFFALMTILAHLLQSSGVLRHSITTEHYHDLGKLIFAFTVFWAYIAFSQYMLQWYASLPEETAWFLVRQKAPWLWLSLVLLFGKFVVPFLVLISRGPKRQPALLVVAAVWVLAMQYLDVTYLALPPYFFSLVDKPEYFDASTQTLLAVPYQPLTHLLSLLLLLGMGGLIAGQLLAKMASLPLVPVRDPRLGESLAFENF